jgi:hypothetical protein
MVKEVHALLPKTNVRATREYMLLSTDLVTFGKTENLLVVNVTLVIKYSQSNGYGVTEYRLLYKRVTVIMSHVKYDCYTD